jgi:hypothetical protein
MTASAGARQGFPQMWSADEKRNIIPRTSKLFDPTVRMEFPVAREVNTFQ